MKEIKLMFSKKNLFNVLFIALIAIIIFVPSTKAFVIRGLMEIGLFKPNTAQKAKNNIDLSAIKFKASDGKILSLSALKGKIIFVNVWATWCPPCVAEMPSINQLYQKYKQDPNIAFVMVDADGDFNKSQAFMARKKYNMPLYTFYSTLPPNLLGQSIPTTFVFDKQGRLAFREEGAANYSSKKFINFIEELKALKN
jgi:thiol-disulfide isomerase/thioredoxin